MLARLGFVASVLSLGLTTSRTCRLKNATPERISEIVFANLITLNEVINFLERNRILLYRMTSNLVPFASHPVNTVAWWDEFAPQFAALGNRLLDIGIRASTHPGQFTVLNSPNAAVVKASIAELEYHARFMDAMGVDRSGKIVLHIGGLYGGTEADAMARFCAVASSLPDAVRKRLVIENDDRLFDAEEVLAAAQRINVPVVFDWLHHHANPCRAPLDDVLQGIFATWAAEGGDNAAEGADNADEKHGRPKVHLSSQAQGGPPGAHADFIDVKDALAFFEVMGSQPFDCMLEAKQKDFALLKLRADLSKYGIVETDLTASLPSSAQEEKMNVPAEIVG